MLINEPTGGRLGNQLFAYVFSRLLAEQLNYAMYTIPIIGFPATKDEKLLHGMCYSSANLPETLVVDADETFESIVNRCRKTRVRVRGFFEQSRYYLPHLDKICEWLKPLFMPPSNYAAIHMRGTDFDEHCKSLPISYFEAALAAVDADISSTLVITDDPHHTTVQHLLRRGCSLCHSTPLKDFEILRRAERLIIGRSTFAWWAAVLSDAKVIAQPAPVTGHRSPADVLSYLTMPNWVQIPC